MEIIAEIVFAIFGGLVEFLFGIVFQVIAEILGGIFGAVGDASSRERSLSAKRWAAVAAYIAGGLGAGALSLYFAPALLLDHGWQRAFNLLLMPVAVGLLMQVWDNWRQRPDRPDPALPGFVRGYLFALAMTSVRFVWGK